ncbi:centrosomal protein of 97 kDa [Trichonephila inaurata madagascariensis]|uniref:Centrosomal protein of 97 kDa n=1 Tax=Trichonephila inaurata madagascariensis TaxID=2747483 RepID=A0A8X7C719_9ARAC|nr:centrosomal protein of 97 kDa [Trichonephila inaurata madagascariensis]
MAANEKHTLDLSGAGIKKIEKRDGVGFKQLILDNNELTKLENLECFPDLEKVTASGNAIVRMYGVSKCHHLTHINLPNNNIICIEGLKDLPNLTYLNLSVNNIKVIQNLQYSNNLVHLDLSRNNISAISDISNLSKLKVLHLNGNKISTLNRASTYFPTCICTLSLSDNCITDLNEVSHLVKLHCLEQLTISGNPCLSIEELSLPPFDYRPFIINWCLGLRLLDGHVATQKESLKAEWLYSQGKGRHYKPGEHMELIEYLCQVCPITADQSTDEEDEKLIRILHKQRQHKEQFLNEMAQVPQSEISEAPTGSSISMTQSYHFKTETSPKNQETEMSASSNIVPSKIMYESAPEVLFHSTTSETIQSVPPSFQSGKYPRSVSKSEILHSSIKSPIMIEQVEVESSTKPKIQEPTKSPYQYYEDRRVRPSSSSEIRPTHTPKGTLIRKVSKRATSPCTSAPPGGRSKLPHSTSRNRISPSRSCILTARLSAAAKNSSESDTSEEVSHTNRTPQRSFRSLSTDTQSGSNSPVLQQHVYSSLSPTKRAFGMDSGPQTQITSSPKFGHGSSPHIAKSKTMSEIYGKSEEDIVRAATKIQSVWRGYFVRHHNHRVFKLLQEIRFRRLEDHIQHLHGHLCRLTDFVLRQQQDLQHERELRKMQAEDIRHLHEKAKDLQKSVSVVLAKAKSNVFQNLSEQDTSNRDLSRDNSMLPDAKFDKHLPSQSSDSLNLALKFSTQMYQESSSIYSPSSQTSSVTSSVPDTSFSRSKSRRELQPSASDISDADSGMQSMVSPNIAAGECERHHSSHEMDHSAMNGYADSCAYPSYKGDLSDYTRKYSGKFHSEKESHYEENAALHTKISKHPKSLSSIRHALPVSAIPSLDEDTCYTQSSHMPNTHFSKNFMSLNKTNYVEYPNSSIENSPCSVNSEPYVFCKQHLYSNTMPNPSCQSKSEECNKWKNSCVSNGFTDVDSAPKCYSKSCMAHQMKDKINVHHGHCARSCSQNTCKLSEKGEKSSEDSNCTAKSCTVLPKRLNQLTQNKVTSPLEEKDSPSSPCTVEMSGCISHSCSFQSDGFAAEELSATATVKLFSTRAVSMTCTNGTMSPQTNPQRPLTLSDASPQANLRSPLVLAASVWEKKVQDIESTFHQLQTQIRDLEGAFGQIGQFGQFFYPSLLQEESKEVRPAIHCAEQAPGALVLDMPKINFKRSDNANDRLFQTCFAGSVPYLPPSSQQQAMNQSNDCRVEEIDQDVHSIVEERDELPNPTSDNTETKS